MSEVFIREFQAGDEESFRRLNEEWITQYFRLEPKDVAVLGDPQSNILAPGGRILFATLGDECVACCALLAVAPREYEVGKMAVTARCQGQGIGRKVLLSAIETARSAGARRLWLETNRVLGTAIHLYESVGFQHVPAERRAASPYARSDVQMEMLLE
ncbi:MAG: GNAT family N-acetyltransferase [Candidatus Solibacter sp.]